MAGSGEAGFKERLRGGQQVFAARECGSKTLGRDVDQRTFALGIVQAAGDLAHLVAGDERCLGCRTGICGASALCRLTQYPAGPGGAK